MNNEERGLPRDERPTDYRNSRHSDRELIARILQGDASAQQEFVIRFQRLIYAILNRMHLQSHDRDDIFQQVFLHLWSQECRCLQQWHGKGSGEFRSYLGVIVVRLALDHLRRGAAAIKRDDAYLRFFLNQQTCGTEDDFVSRLIAAAQRRTIHEALHELSVRDTELLWRRYYVEQSYAEIARQMNLSVNHVGVALSRAQKRLGRHLHADTASIFQEFEPDSDSQACKKTTA